MSSGEVIFGVSVDGKVFATKKTAGVMLAQE